MTAVVLRPRWPLRSAPAAAGRPPTPPLPIPLRVAIPEAVPATTGWPPAVELPAQKETDLEKAADAAGCELLEPKNEGGEHISDLTQRVELQDESTHVGHPLTSSGPRTAPT